ncbi:hypothetical protein D3C72_1390650 [compost metagenome]
MHQQIHARIAPHREKLALLADDRGVFGDLVADAQLVEQMLADPAVGDQQVNSPAYQFAEVGFMGGGRLAGEQRRIAEVLAVQVTRRGADGQAAQVIEGAKRMGPLIGVEQHELHFRQWFAGVEKGRITLIAVKDVQRAVGLA